MKDFDLERAKADDPVVDEEGRDVTILMFDFRGDGLIVAVTHRKNADSLFYYNEKGVPSVGGYCLKMKPIKVERWVNVYKNRHGVGEASPGVNFYTSKDEASRRRVGNLVYIDSVKVEWEE